ncbi:hypothetical protein E4T39_07801 [Aureobasidium subglaciale]|nr:hypothetical protein E4T39_07801 [Aureobasidium subglaciale]
MVLDGGVGTATAIGSAANISLRLFQVIYEFKAVGEQTRDLLDSTKHVSSTLESARTMRQQKSSFLSTDERKWIDSIIIDTKRCLESVAALVEPARVDLQTKSGRVGFVNRSLFVFRDSPKVATNLARLNLAHQSLNAAMGVLCSKGTYQQPASELQAMGQQELVSPPSYERDQFLQRGKLPRNGSISTIRSQRQSQPHLLSDDAEKFVSAHVYSQGSVGVVELEGSELYHPSQPPVEMCSETTFAPPLLTSEDFEGLQVVESDGYKLRVDYNGLAEMHTQYSEYSHGQLPMSNSSAYNHDYSALSNIESARMSYTRLMMGNNIDPEIVVGIDFGMTCTGVAYSVTPEWLAPTTIQHWPGKLGFETRNKVDTILAYKPEGGGPVSWGFLVDHNRDDLVLQELFKLWLDPGYREESDSQQSNTIEEARTSFVDYMRCVYEAILAHFDDTYPRWRTRQVEFLFSVPTTWETPITIANTEHLLRDAGFGTEPGHVAKISLTEAEAAAVYVSKQSYQVGDIFLVCDAGGGTTDINALKVKDNRSFRTELEPLRSVQGEAIGSTLIDFKVESIIAERLGRISNILTEPSEKLARSMMSDKFETFKCSFGSSTQNDLDLLLPIPGLPSGMNYPAAHIRSSNMVITRDELRRIFDEMIDSSYLVVSGGFGSSPYLKQRLRKRYELNGRDELFNARSIKILSAKEPQLACVNSTILDFIKGQRVSVKEGVIHPYCLKLNRGAEQIPWSTHIVMSSLSADHLPRSTKHQGVKPLHWYNVGRQYYLATFDMKVIVGPADIRFEIWTRDGRISKTHEEIEVIWDPLITG